MDMSMASSNLLLLLVSQATFICLTAAALKCSDDAGNFTPDSTYGINRNRLLTSLSFNITSSAAAPYPNLYRETAGEGTDDVVYGVVLCRGDATLAGCSRCANTSSQSIIDGCPYQKEAIDWGDQCSVRCSHRYIFGSLERTPTSLLTRTDTISADLEDRFKAVRENLTNDVLARASAASNTNRFATAQARYSDFGTMHVMMQCTADIMDFQCADCLQEAAGDFKRCCDGNLGGVSDKPSCRYRNEVYSFLYSDPGSNNNYNAPPPPAPTPVSPPPPSSPSKDIGHEKESMSMKSQSRRVIVFGVPSVILSALLLALACFALITKREPRNKVKNQDESEVEDSLKFNFATIQSATKDFSDANMLGRGGFGSVYRGQLPNGQEIAVKRLAQRSSQGEQEFKNEILVLAKLQHRNLVRLIGFCLENGERILIYEYMASGSLDRFISDSTKGRQLDWAKRRNIIDGIARGILYLHEESKLRIIHHDLKAGNVLLDREMNPKVADFGLARLFVVSFSRGNTKHIAGTYGYMPPEYVNHGEFSVKTDVFSFGVLLLEIISGKSNNSFQDSGHLGNLITHVWKKWRKGSISNLVDKDMKGGSAEDIKKCIHVGLLCVQEKAALRPTMSSVVVMLNSETVPVQRPSKPAFLLQDSLQAESMSQARNHARSTNLARYVSPSEHVSVNVATISELDPR